ncbi:MAG: tetratricopeptide repeat protein [Phototrophicaceae bacterium]
MRLFKQLQSQPTTPIESSPSVATLMKDANRAKHAENYEEALDLLDRAMEVADELENTRHVLTLALRQADILIEMKQYENAQTVLRTLVDSTSLDTQPETNAHAQTSLAYSELVQGNLESARTLLENLRTGTKDPHLIWRAEGYLARVYMLEGNGHYALRLLTDPTLSSFSMMDDAESFMLFSSWIAQIHGESQQFDLSILNLEHALNLATKYHLRKFERELGLMLAQVQLQQGLAEEAYQHLIQSASLMRQSQLEQNFDIHFHLSRASLLTQRHPEALFHAEVALEKSHPLSDAKHHQATLQYADVLARMGRVEDARQVLQKARQATSETPYQDQLDFQIGLTHLHTQDYSQALSVFYDLYARPNHDLHYPLDELLGLAHLKLGQVDLTLKHWISATKHDAPPASPEKQARLWIQLAQLRFQVGQASKAYKEMEHALELLGRTEDIATRGVVISNAAVLLHERGEVESARSFLEESLALARLLEQPAVIASRVGNLGRVMMDVGQTRLAIPLLEEAVQLAKTHHLTLIASIHTNNLGVAHAHLSQYKTALDYHRQALSQLEGQPFYADESHWQTLIRVDCAHALLSLASYDEARTLLNQAHTEAQSLMHYPTRLLVLNALARLNLVERHFDEATFFLEQSLSQAKQADYKRLLAQSLVLQSELLSLRQDLEQAQVAWEEAQALYTMLQSPLARQAVSWLKG